jgi:uncharacterized cupredoxin-like copper-binding protein
MVRLRTVTTVVMLALALVACGGGNDADDTEDLETGFGATADPADATRTIEVTADDSLRFDPDTFEVAAGEVVTFSVTNAGQIQHEFVIGDETAQQAMAAEMAEGGEHGAHGAEPENAITIPPGATMELTWEFGAPGTVLVGCHEPGHYDAGMRAEIVVN